MLGASATRHRRSIIFRREYVQLKGLFQRAETLFSKHGSWNGQDKLWRLHNDIWLEFGACQYPGDEQGFQGRDHDLKGFDEITHFTKFQFEFLKGWRRTAIEGQRTRVIATGNPPMDAEGDWVIEYWAPWLDPGHPRPARDGELRYFVMIDGKSVEVPDKTPIVVAGEDDPVVPESRTFIRARVQDNAYYMRSGYLATLQALPEPLRSAMLFGEFGAGRLDNAWQVIPTEWVLKAQARWRPDGHNGQPMDALGVDVARGGADNTVLTPRHGTWFGAQVAEHGRETPDGLAVIGLILATLGRSPVRPPDGQQTAINMDTIAVGSSPQDIGKMHGLKIVPCIGSGKSEGRDRTGQFGFVNLRAEWIWKLREALDPDLGEDLAIPPDRGLTADLTAVRWKLTPRGIQCEAKEEIIKRIGRSPDKGDSLIYSYAQTQTIAQAWLGWVKEQAEAKAARREN